MQDVERKASTIGREEVVARLRRFFSARGSEVVAAYLFGSVARGEARYTSDVDVAVLFPAPPPATLEGVPVELESELTRLLGTRTEVVVLNRAPVDLVKRVLRDGVLVAESDRSRRVAFEVRARNAYWDLLPVLRLYRTPRERAV